MNKRSYILLLLLCAALGGCIGEDNGDCAARYGVELQFRNMEPTRSGDDFLDRVGSVRAVFYDAAGNYLLDRAVSRNDLHRFQGLRLSLPQGEYTAVCWGNASGANTRINYTKHLDASDEALYHPDYTTARAIPTNDPLYYGRVSFTVQPQTESHTVYFKPAHVKLRIEVRGIQYMNPPPADIDKLSIRITNLYPAYTNGMIPSGRVSTYYPKIITDAVFQEAGAWCNILRFDGDDNPIAIEVAPDAAAAAVHTEPLAAFMTTHGLTIRDGHELAISIVITFRPVGGVHVTIGPWTGQPTLPGGM